MPEFHLSRRSVIAAAASIGAAPVAFAAGMQNKLDLSTPRDQLRAYAKMRATVNGGLAIWHHAIDMFALIEGRVSEFLFKREGISVHKIRIEADDSLTVHYVASTYPVDGGNVKDGVWKNHITGRDVKLHALPGAKGPVVRVTAPGLNGAKNAERDLAPPSAERYVIGTPTVFGGRISISDDMLVYRTAEEQQRIFTRAASMGDYTATELGAYESELADVMNPKRANAPASRAMVGVVPWGPDMGMDGLTGKLMIRHRARKVARADDLPQWLSERAEGDSPGIFTTPKLAI